MQTFVSIGAGVFIDLHQMLTGPDVKEVSAVKADVVSILVMGRPAPNGVVVADYSTIKLFGHCFTLFVGYTCFKVEYSEVNVREGRLKGATTQDKAAVTHKVG